MLGANISKGPRASRTAIALCGLLLVLAGSLASARAASAFTWSQPTLVDRLQLAALVEISGLSCPSSSLCVGAQLSGEDVGEEIFFGVEVGVEGAVRQAGVGHQGRHAGAVDAVLLEAPPRSFDDPFSGGLLVALAVAHDEPPLVDWSSV